MLSFKIINLLNNIGIQVTIHNKYRKEKDLEKWGISRPKISNLKTIESGILEQFDKEMEIERLAKLGSPNLRNRLSRKKMMKKLVELNE